MTEKRIIIGCDHGGLNLKNKVIEHFNKDKSMEVKVCFFTLTELTTQETKVERRQLHLLKLS